MKIVVAYSGGLDTSVLLLWLKEKYNAEIIAYCADVGQAEELDGLEEKALSTGASKCYIGDLKEEFAADYFHAKGVTRGCEPGGVLSKPLQDAQNNVLSSTDNPFRFYFIPDGKSIIAAYPDAVVEETQKVLSWGRGMTAMVPGQVKLFADGAIYSQVNAIERRLSGWA